MRITLIRHGQTDSNLNQIIDAEYPGPPLNDTGLAQAAELVERLGDQPLTAIYTSDIIRTPQTAQPLADKLGIHIVQLPGLREIPAGDQQGATDHGPYVEMLNTWRTDPTFKRPGAESLDEFLARYDDAIDFIASEGHDHVAVVSHGAAMRVWTPLRASNLSIDHPTVRPLHNVETIILEGESGNWTCLEWAGEPID